MRWRSRAPSRGRCSPCCCCTPTGPVSAERLASALWGEDAPAGAANTVQVHVSRLRKALPAARMRCVTTRGRLRAARRPATSSTRTASSGSPPRAASELAAGRARARRPRAARRRSPLWRGAAARRPRVRAVRPARDRPPGGAAGRRARGARRGEARARPPRGGASATSSGSIAEHPYRERLRGAADARAVPLRPPGRRAAGLPGRPRARWSTSSGSSRARGCASSSRRSSPRTPRWASVAAPAGRRAASAPRAGVARLRRSSAAARRTLDPEVHGRPTPARASAAIERHGGTAEGFAGDAVVGVFGQRGDPRGRRAARRPGRAGDAASGRAWASRSARSAGEVFVGRRGARRGGARSTAAARLRHDRARRARSGIGADHAAPAPLRRQSPARRGGCRDRRAAAASTRSWAASRELDALQAAFERCLRRARLHRGHRGRSRGDRASRGSRASWRCA